MAKTIKELIIGANDIMKELSDKGLLQKINSSNVELRPRSKRRKIDITDMIKVCEKRTGSGKWNSFVSEDGKIFIQVIDVIDKKEIDTLVQWVLVNNRYPKLVYMEMNGNII